MLIKFTISNFRNFERAFTLDLKADSSFDYNQECVQNGYVNNAIIYGVNGVGKTNFLIALNDITKTLVGEYHKDDLNSNFLNADSNLGYATYRYEYLINDALVVYQYQKYDRTTFKKEELLINGERIIFYDRASSEPPIVNLKGTENLKMTSLKKDLSLVRYIRLNANWNNQDPHGAVFEKFLEFVASTYYSSNVLLESYNVLKDQNFDNLIIENDLLNDFEIYLNNAGVKCQLGLQDTLEGKVLVFRFKERSIRFLTSISRGTATLCLQYIIMTDVNLKCLLFDEFDAHYHNRLAVNIVDTLKETGKQFVMTTHNISVMSNSLLRPDCYFVMNQHGIKSLPNTTPKELREEHNLSRMYQANRFEFDQI